jgi:hypothetical protein
MWFCPQQFQQVLPLWIFLLASLAPLLNFAALPLKFA